jgi:hypothetical protein
LLSHPIPKYPWISNQILGQEAQDLAGHSAPSVAPGIIKIYSSHTSVSTLQYSSDKRKQNNQRLKLRTRREKITAKQLQIQRLLFDKTHRLNISAHIMYITLTTFFLFPQSSFADHLTLRECRGQICLLRILFPVVVFAQLNFALIFNRLV